MKVIWVLENIKKGHKFFLPEIELLGLISSISNWKKLYPDTDTHLYCDSSVFEYLNKIEISDLWDNIHTEELDSPDLIDRKPFWAASKIKIIKDIEAPFIIMDCDLYFKRKSIDLELLSDFDIVTNQIEDGIGYYPTKRDPVIKDMKDPFEYKTPHAFNVAFLYIGDEKIRKEYSDLSYSWMEELSIKNLGSSDLNGKHMIFCEQKMLKEFSDLYNSKVACLADHSIRGAEEKINLLDGYESFNLNNSDYVHLHRLKNRVKYNTGLLLDTRSDIIKSIYNIDKENLKKAFSALKFSNEDLF
jgi:hypothetical protein